jgi:heptosyltransferase III
MFFRLSRSSKVERILLISLSNIGDVVLTFPVLDSLRAAFPQASLHVVVGPKAAGLLEGNPNIERVIPFNKKMPLVEMWQWVSKLRRERYDIVIDLRNSVIPFFLGAKVMTPPSFSKPFTHMKQKHLKRLRDVFPEIEGSPDRYAVYFSSGSQEAVHGLVGGRQGYVLLAPGAADPRKRWNEDGFRAVIHYLRKQDRAIVLVGDPQDALVSRRFMEEFPEGVIDLCGKTSLLELAGVVARGSFAITNDSGIMHLASYFDKPVLALFGPTDPFFYGPWGAKAVALRRGISVDDIKPSDVIVALDGFL